MAMAVISDDFHSRPLRRWPFGRRVTGWCASTRTCTATGRCASPCWAPGRARRGSSGAQRLPPYFRSNYFLYVYFKPKPRVFYNFFKEQIWRVSNSNKKTEDMHNNCRHIKLVGGPASCAVLSLERPPSTSGARPLASWSPRDVRSSNHIGVNPRGSDYFLHRAVYSFFRWVVNPISMQEFYFVSIAQDLGSRGTLQKIWYSACVLRQKPIPCSWCIWKD